MTAKATQSTSALANRLRIALRRRLFRLWHTKPWVAFRLDVCDYEQPPDTPDGVIFRHAQAEELDSLARLAGHMGPSARKILARQFVCPKDVTMIGTDAETGDLVFHVWLSHEDLGLKVLGDWVLPPAASLRRVWVAPSRRGTGIATIAFKMLLASASADGTSQVWSFVGPDNMPSLRLHDKLGFSRAGQIRLKARFGRKHLISRCHGHQGARRIAVAPDFRTL